MLPKNTLLLILSFFKQENPSSVAVIFMILTQYAAVNLQESKIKRSKHAWSRKMHIKALNRVNRK